MISKIPQERGYINWEWLLYLRKAHFFLRESFMRFFLIDPKKIPSTGCGNTLRTAAQIAARYARTSHSAQW